MTIPRTPTVLVLGLGISGLSMARWIARSEGAAAVRVADTRAAPPNLARLQSELPGAQFVAGPFTEALLDGVQTMLVSPGLAPHDLEAMRATARARGVRVHGELNLFAQALYALAGDGYVPKVLAVTGTNGKTTVTCLTSLLVERAGLSVARAGNIGPALMDVLTARIEAGTLPQAWVLELSSFQLDAAEGFEPTAATVLNITQDHLDWHGGMNAYAAAKARVFGACGAMVLNRDDPRVWAMRPANPSLPPAPARGGKAKARREPPRTVVSFGANPPAAPGDYGLEDVGGMTWLVRALTREEAGETERRSNAGGDGELHIQRLMPADALRIRGRHNALNALAALALAGQAGCALAPMLYGLREYRGEPHRVEPAGSVDGVEYFDDSKGTNVGATVAALQGLGAERRLVVIVGGDGKGQDFAPLREPVARHARAAVLIGRDGGLIRAALEDAGVPLIDAPSLEQAVALAHEQARAGDAVLLSPACASFDMFRDYEHRAEVFRAAVRELAAGRGVALEDGA
ncbi:MAG: UDP-N-acetylmuramoyl-L-alanine--D-glutamate ligase [Burkholderiaceae bacterium]|jgi:UDP-N-acetylmuramoylalanine--D-glutamate ligase|nr:UDP-N-acetylmuramoyl-L-alanine--D-glutamate ligase [Burkholderiaceae bacterium]